MVIISCLVEALPSDNRRLFLLGITLLMGVQLAFINQFTPQSRCVCVKDGVSVTSDNLRPYDVDGRLRTTRNPPPAPVSILKANTHICDGPQPVQLLIYIHSNPKNVKRRFLLRETWANPKLFADLRIRTVFIVGIPEDQSIKDRIEAENSTFGDIIQGDFLDTYKNLTLKSLTALKWVTQYCSNAVFALKADDDAFLNIFEILDILQSNYIDKARSIVCPLWRENSMPILRNPENCMKWCIGPEDFPGQRFYPQYCAGITYVLPLPVVADMLNAASRTPFFWIDDVYVTGLLTKNVNQSITYKSVLERFRSNANVALEYLARNDTQFAITHALQEVQMHRLWTATLRTIKWRWKQQIDKGAALKFLYSNASQI